MWFVQHWLDRVDSDVIHCGGKRFKIQNNSQVLVAVESAFGSHGYKHVYDAGKAREISTSSWSELQKEAVSSCSKTMEDNTKKISITARERGKFTHAPFCGSCSHLNMSFRRCKKKDSSTILARIDYIYPPIGPGPGRYQLPPCCGRSNHDPSKKSMPAYSFGKRLENSSKSWSATPAIIRLKLKLYCMVLFLLVFAKDCSPGPIYYINPVLSRFGHDGTPSYSLLGRPRNLSMQLQ